jgi:hypothetical protein
MSSPIPGDEKSEGSGVAPRPCFGVDGMTKMVVRSELSVEEVLRGGRGGFKLVSPRQTAIYVNHVPFGSPYMKSVIYIYHALQTVSESC